MAKRLVPAHSRRLAALALLGALGACATTTAEPRPAAVQAAGWRIVERIGEARYSPPGAAAWTSATVGETLVDGSEVSTGGGGRLIVDAPGRHISVGPDSRFVLPDRERDDPLNQRAGWLRFRIAEAESQPFRIHTRSLELELRAGVVDVHVNHLATEVTVKEGQVRVATPDGLRQTQMMAGQSAHAAGSDETQLSVRLTPGAALQPVDPVIVPAIQTRSTPTEMPGTSARASSPPAGPPAPSIIERAPAPPDEGAAHEAPALRHDGTPQEDRSDGVHAAPAPVASASGSRLRAADHVTGAAASGAGQGQLARPGAPDPATQPVERPPVESEAAAIRRGKFERLTAGMLDQVEAPPPATVWR